jgi:hypothetical protein
MQYIAQKSKQFIALEINQLIFQAPIAFWRARLYCRVGAGDYALAPP